VCGCVCVYVLCMSVWVCGYVCVSLCMYASVSVFVCVESDKIPSWVHDIFVWYADETISENELLAALEYLISQGTINVNSN